MVHFFTRNKLATLMLLLTFLGLTTRSNAQGSAAYSFAASTGTYTPITGTTSTATDDDGTQNAIPIGFNFTFAGTTYTTFSVTTNGMMRLGADIITGLPNYTNTYFGTINNTNKPNLAAFWDDNNLTGGTIIYNTTGTTGNQILTVQWTNSHLGGSGSSTNPTGSFQIKLYEGSNNIQYVYGTTSAALTASSTTIGISSDFTNFSSVTPTTSTTSTSTANNTISTFPAANTIYTFTPPMCSGMPSPGNTITSASSSCFGNTVTLSLQNITEGNGVTYFWQTSTDGITYSTATGINNLPTYSSTPLVTTYYKATVTCGGQSAQSAPVQVTVGLPSSIPWNEGFESLTPLGSNSFPSCWHKENGDWASSNDSTNYNTAHSGSKYIRDSWSATNEYIWTPQFQLTAGTSYDFSFFVQSDGYPDWIVDVFYNTTQSSVGATQMGSTYIPVQNGNTLPQPYTIRTHSFTPTTSGPYCFAVRVNANGNPWYLAFDDFSLNVTPSCQTPMLNLATNIAGYSATINWNASGTVSPAGYEWEVRTSGTPGSGGPGLAQSGSITGPTVTANVTGLNPLTNYNAYVRTNCGGGSFSAWSPATPFKTTCGVYTVPYLQDFDSSPQCWTKGVGLLSASTTFTGAAGNWGLYYYGNASSTPSNIAAAINIYGTNRKDWIISPSIALGMTPRQLEFNMALTKYDTTLTATLGVDDTLAVVISTNNGATWSNANILQKWTNATSISNTGDHYTIDLTPYTGIVKLAFYATSTVANADNDLFIDSFKVVTNPCPIVNLGADVAICGSSLSLDAGNAGATYLWDDATTAQTRIITAGGTYYVAVTNNGCTRSDSVTVTLNPFPIVNLGNDTTICSGNPLILNAGNAGATYVWNDNTTNQTKAVTTAGTYSTKVTTAANCSASDTITVAVMPTPAATISSTTATPGVYTFGLVTPLNVMSSFWKFGDGGTATGSPANHTYTQNGTYNVTVSLIGICNDTINVTKSIVVSGIVGINTIHLSADLLTLYPNPANHILNISNKSEYEMKHVSVYNVVGQMIYNAASDSKNNHKIQLAHFASGLYTLKVETDKGFVMRKFEVIK